MIFTIGPSSEKESTLRELIKIGMNVARLNFSHGNQETHLKKIQLIKKLRDEMYTPTAIMIDIKGPKIRTHRFINDEIPLKQGQTFSFNCGKEIFGNNSECSISYATLYEDVRPGGLMLVDDGLIRFRINEIVGKKIVCTVLNDGVIKNYKGVNVPNIKLNLPSITEKDKSDLAFACKMDVDFVAASFIRKASDILEVRQILKEHGGNNIQVIAKIENQEGVDNIDSIIEVSDGIMIARGDMGVEIPIEHVPIIQKMIIKKCNKAGKIVITATQMLDSMIRNSIPTRAEASDICNAIFDGTDAIMLSGESASGLYPLEAARTMSTIAQEAEANIDYMYLNQQLKEPAMNDFAEAISYSACRTSNVLNANAKNDLASFATVLKNNTDCEVSIQGYTDSTGNDGINLPLSQKRADAVYSYLSSCGVTRNQVKTVEGLGSSNPVVNTTAACAQNRRVEVYLYASQAMVNAANNGTLK